MNWLGHSFAKNPDKLFLEQPGGKHFTYSDLDREVGRYTGALIAVGVRQGDRVVVQAEKSPEFLFLYLATLRSGAIFVPLNTAYTPAEMEYFLMDSEPRVFVARPGADIVLDIAHRLKVPSVLTLGSSGDGTLPELASRQEPSKGSPAGASDPAAILYTSGTTGRSKGAVLTVGNLESNAKTLAREWRFTSEDVLLHALPVFHVHGLFVAVNTLLASGGSLLFLSSFQPDEALRFLPRATCFMGVPTYYTRLLQNPSLNAETTREVRLFVSGSAPLLAETHRLFEERTGHQILERYGMTETLMNASNPYDGERIAGTVGLPLPGVEVRVAGEEEIGILEVRGPNVFKGYWRNPEKTAQEFTRDGFFITGDLGRIDERGYVTIVGRGKDLVISGGYNVYPKEVESEIDAIDGVAESAVIGVPHPDFGEGVTAVIVTKPGATIEPTKVLEYLATRLAKYKLPKRVLFVDELPRNTMGKVQKNALKERYRELYTDGRTL